MNRYIHTVTLLSVACMLITLGTAIDGTAGGVLTIASVPVAFTACVLAARTLRDDLRTRRGGSR